eukprot:m.63020 g.63020  ORF g.63020 m.63020 type:complete len:535 (-) comp49610_c0_seq2:97-1701(-)
MVARIADTKEFKPPCARTLTSLMDAESINLRSNVVAEVQTYLHTSLSVDKWTAPHTGEAYVGLTSCGLTSNGPNGSLVREHRVLTVQIYPSTSCDAENFAESVKDIARPFISTMDSVCSITTDTENTMLKAGREYFGAPHVGCICHIAQRMIHHLSDIPRVERLLRRSRELELHCRNNHQMMVVLGDLFDRCVDSSVRRIQLAGATRWNSVDTCLRLLYQSKALINAALRQVDSENETQNYQKYFLTENEWNLIPLLLECVSSLVELTNRAQDRDFLLCEVTPRIFTMKNHLITRRDQKKSKVYREMIDLLVRELTNYDRLDAFYLAATSIGMKAAVFHHRYKQLLFVSDTAREETYSACAQEHAEFFPEKSIVRPTPDSDDPYEVVSHDDQPPTFRSELEDYIRHVPANMKTLTVLEYWTLYQTSFPRVFSLAAKYLTMLATSAEAERAFSIAKHMHAERRCAMTPSSAKSGEVRESKNVHGLEHPVFRSSARARRPQRQMIAPRIRMTIRSKRPRSADPSDPDELQRHLQIS